VLIKFEAEATSLKPRLKCPKAKAEAEARGYDDKTEARTKFWPRGQFGLEALTALAQTSAKLSNLHQK